MWVVPPMVHVTMAPECARLNAARGLVLLAANAYQPVPPGPVKFQ
jgi:hypothetical protein